MLTRFFGKNAFFVFYLGLFLVSTGNGWAGQIRTIEPHRMQGIKEWVVNRFYSQDPNYTECTEVIELGSTFLCVSSTTGWMNAALTRASVYSEGTTEIPAGTLIRKTDPMYKILRLRVGGHDIRGTELGGFFNEAERQCKTDPSFCLDEAETEWYHQFILPTLQKNPNMVLVTYSKSNLEGFPDVVSHELLHAQYFLDKNYREAVDSFWDGLSVSEQTSIREELDTIYDVSNDFVIKNELQAYCLPYGGNAHGLGSFQDRLYRHLEKKGVVPLAASLCPKLPRQSAISRVTSRSYLDINPWISRQYDYSNPTLTECSEMAEQPGVFMCAASRVDLLDRALKRVAIFAGGKGQIISQSEEPTYSQMFYDFDGKTLTAFYEAVQTECVKDTNKCLNEVERDWFENFILPTLKEKSEMIVVGFDIFLYRDPSPVITVLLRSKYQLNPDYRAAIQAFWDTLSAEEVQTIEKPLHERMLRGDEIKGEFQSYCLSNDRPFDHVFEPFRQRLESFLKDYVPTSLSPNQ